jgi:hypothetical protein
MNQMQPSATIKYDLVAFRVSKEEKNVFDRIKKELRLSVRKVLEQLPEQPCNSSEIIIYNKRKTKYISLPKDFLKKK